MNPFVHTLLDYMLTHNLVFMLVFAVLPVVTAGMTVKQTFTAGLKWAAAILCGMLAASAWLAVLPAGAAFLVPAGVLLLTLLIVRWLMAWGLCEGEWAGMPRSVLAYVPLAGSMLLVQADALAGLDAVAAALGAALGVTLAIVIVSALIEQIRISEAPAPCRRIGVLFFALAVFALAFAGFRML